MSAHDAAQSIQSWAYRNAIMSTTEDGVSQLMVSLSDLDDKCNEVGYGE